jgi:flavin-dependent dehydrogenase
MNAVHTQVAIIGAGPAGSSLATFLRQRGIDCVIFEKEKFPRFHVGESLLPENIKQFEQLGVADKIKAMGFQIKPGATFIQDRHKDGQDERVMILFKNSYFRAPGHAVNVKRADFDDLLLRHAVSLGATLYEETNVTQFLMDGQRMTGLKATTADGETIECRASMVADCSGQNAVLARKIGVKKDDPKGHARAAFYCHFEGVQREAPPNDGNIILAWAPERWYWLIPLAGSATSVGVVVSKRLLEAHWRGNAEAFMDEMIGQSEAVRTRLANARRIVSVRSTVNYSYDTTQFAGDGWLLVGDAAAFLDPIYSTGISIAIAGARYAAESIQTALTKNDTSAASFKSYESRVRKAQNFFKPLIYGWYDPACQEVLRKPRNVLGLLPVMISLLGGDVFSPWKRFLISWRMPLFWLAVAAERRKLAWQQRRLARPMASDGTA